MIEFTEEKTKAAHTHLDGMRGAFMQVFTDKMSELTKQAHKENGGYPAQVATCIVLARVFESLLKLTLVNGAVAGALAEDPNNREVSAEIRTGVAEMYKGIGERIVAADLDKEIDEMIALFWKMRDEHLAQERKESTEH